MKFINDCYTKDKLKLPMIHYESLEKDICIVCVHGMCSNFLNNSFYHIWGEYVSNNNIGFIYFYNRGHDIESLFRLYNTLIPISYKSVHNMSSNLIEYLTWLIYPHNC